MIDHFVITGSSLEATLSFYERALGMKRSVLPDKPASLLFNNQKIKVHVVDKTFEPEAAHPTPGTADFCLTTSRPSDEIQGHLQCAGIAIEPGPVARSREIPIGRERPWFIWNEGILMRANLIDKRQEIDRVDVATDGASAV